MLVILRLMVYFRDAYRATSFGIPDLVDLIQDIDEKLEKKLGSRLENKVQLSFIGHSMGAYVVTGAVRILSDVFSPPSVSSEAERAPMWLRRDIPTERHRLPPEQRKIGHAFTLKGLVLVSPDIPAESLVTGRASFLAASVERFEEAYLFSSKDDVVLRLVSRVANYFSVPTCDRKFGYRLGNLDMRTSPYGIKKEVAFDQLHIGSMTLQDIQEKLRGDQEPGAPGSSWRHLQRFSYFDCTECVDVWHPELSLPRPFDKIAAFLPDIFVSKLTLPWPFNKLGIVTYLALLLSYIFARSPDVHSGYFKSDFLRQLIYRVNCLGWTETVHAYGGFDLLERACAKHRIKGVLRAYPCVKSKA